MYSRLPRTGTTLTGLPSTIDRDRAVPAEDEVHAPGLEPEPQLRARAGHDPLAARPSIARVGELVLLEIAGGKW